MQKPTMFVGSSSEGLATARAAKEQFDREMDVHDLERGRLQAETTPAKMHNGRDKILVLDEETRGKLIAKRREVLTGMPTST
jgi:hypothetical protein